MSASALGLALAFPRTDWSGVAWVLVAPVIVVALTRGPGGAFGWGWLFGGIFFLILLRWLGFTFEVYSAIPWPLTWGPILLLAAYCGLYVGLFAAVVSWLGRRRSPTLALLVTPFLWVAGEWVRGRLMGGFPWGALGYSQYLRLPVIQIAELGGVHAVSFVLLAVNAAVAGCLVQGWRRALAGVGVAAALVGATLGFGMIRLAEPPAPGQVRVAVIQPSIAQPLKGDPDYIISVVERDHIAGYECHGPTPLTEGTFDLYWIVVDPAAQKRGYGRLLLRAAEEDATKRGGRLLLIETSSQPAYDATVRFYKRNGYRLEARVHDFYHRGDDKLILAKDLPAAP